MWKLATEAADETTTIAARREAEQTAARECEPESGGLAGA